MVAQGGATKGWATRGVATNLGARGRPRLGLRLGTHTHAHLGEEHAVMTSRTAWHRGHACVSCAREYSNEMAAVNRANISPHIATPFLRVKAVDEKTGRCMVGFAESSTRSEGGGRGEQGNVLVVMLSYPVVISIWSSSYQIVVILHRNSMQPIFGIAEFFSHE